VRALHPHTALTVTVPHYLPLDLQVELAEQLQQAGADLLQTEGGTSSHPHHGGVQGLIEKAVPTLAAAYTISRGVSIPVICASGLSSVTVPMAIAAGAAGVGVGSAVNRLQSEIEMIAVVKAITDALARSTPKLAH
jgi:thiamine monophosphate synthase